MDPHHLPSLEMLHTSGDPSSCDFLVSPAHRCQLDSCETPLLGSNKILKCATSFLGPVYHGSVQPHTGVPRCGSLCCGEVASCHASTRLPVYEGHGDAVFTMWQGGSRLKHLFTCGMDVQRCFVRCLQARLYGNILDPSSDPCSHGNAQRNRSHRETGREPFSR